MRRIIVMAALVVSCAEIRTRQASQLLMWIDENPVRAHAILDRQCVIVVGRVRAMGMTDAPEHERTTTNLVFGSLVSDTVKVRGRQRGYLVIDDGEDDGPAIVCFADPRHDEDIANTRRSATVRARGRVYEVTSRAILMERCIIE